MNFGFIKPSVDVHTLGLSTIHNLLEECGYKAVLADHAVSEAVESLQKPASFRVFKDWIISNSIHCVGFSYRLDPRQAFQAFERLVEQVEGDSELRSTGRHAIRKMAFAGLPAACQMVQSKYGNRFTLFSGDESPLESLTKLGVPSELQPQWLKSEESYDAGRWAFASDFMRTESWMQEPPLPYFHYPEFGTSEDTLLLRLAALKKEAPGGTLLRAHVGPYQPDRQKALSEFQTWLAALAEQRQLDIVSVGSSQLTQERFGQEWGEAPNGGGVPINSEAEFGAVRQAAKPMLVRAYSSTQNVPEYAAMLERSLNNAWHALSFWWFNQTDGRGPLSVLEGLRQHIQTLKVIARSGKPFEPNISHHFSFRGSDDLSGIVATYLSVRMAKLAGIKTIVLQAMLNTPKVTSGVADLIKVRTLLSLVRTLEDRHFQIVLQPRAGLAYFSPTLNKAKIQLASVSAMMNDLEPLDDKSPKIIHVVSYSEAVELASPAIISESARITRAALRHYREKRLGAELLNGTLERHIAERVSGLRQDAQKMLGHMEQNIPHLYSAEGLHQAYCRGYFPVPQLWQCRNEFPRAIAWRTKLVEGSMKIVTPRGIPLKLEDRLGLIEHLSHENASHEL